MKQEITNIINNLQDNYLIVGVSAGPDSMALLHMLMTNTKKEIVCAHINHNVRSQSTEEEKYLKEYCKENNIIFEVMKIESYHEKNFENDGFRRVGIRVVCLWREDIDPGRPEKC